LEQLATSDPIFEEAKNALKHLSADPDAQALAEERKIWAWNHETEMRLAKKEGLIEGEAKGRLEGEAKGRLEGERVLLAKQLSQKFGPLTDDLRERLEHASESELALWAERILTATTIDEVLG
jgi:flagellar biosynthesis/type III secretory pathway protein FliH